MTEKIPSPKKSIEVLRNPLTNKGSAFTKAERDLLHLHGLLPSKVSTLQEQIDRNYRNFHERRTPIGKYNFLQSLMNRNELLFYQFAEKYLIEVLPLIYTPTVGDAALQYSTIFKTPRGLYLSYPLKEKIPEILQSIDRDIKVVVVTDGERILGLGDQGIGGMAIPVGKLALYTLFGGIHPKHTLPILLDVGTDNEELLKNPLYLGVKKKRVRGEKYLDFIECFVKALRKKFPKVLLQWEDFGKGNARFLLDKYKDHILSFNDDIQGTAAVASAGILAALRVKNQSIKNQKIILFGGGSAGLGIADGLIKMLKNEGLSDKEAYEKIYLIDRFGLIHSNLTNIEPSHKPFVRDYKELQSWKIPTANFVTLLDVEKNIHPTILIGASAQPGVFTKEVIEEMSKHEERPIIFPLSNPTSRAEAFPEEVISWTKGKAIVATGSPFIPVVYEGREYQIGQCNNVYIFPAMGLGSLAVHSKKISDSMFIAATQALSKYSPMLKDPYAPLFPFFYDLKKVTKKIAIAVAKKAIEEGFSSFKGDIEKEIEKFYWHSRYDSWG